MTNNNYKFGRTFHVLDYLKSGFVMLLRNV